jgi:hypothetical protein
MIIITQVNIYSVVQANPAMRSASSSCTLHNDASSLTRHADHPAHRSKRAALFGRAEQFKLCQADAKALVKLAPNDSAGYDMSVAAVFEPH